MKPVKNKYSNCFFYRRYDSPNYRIERYGCCSPQAIREHSFGCETVGDMRYAPIGNGHEPPYCPYDTDDPTIICNGRKNETSAE